MGDDVRSFVTPRSPRLAGDARMMPQTPPAAQRLALSARSGRSVGAGQRYAGARALSPSCSEPTDELFRSHVRKAQQDIGRHEAVHHRFEQKLLELEQAQRHADRSFHRLEGIHSVFSEELRHLVTKTDGHTEFFQSRLDDVVGSLREEFSEQLKMGVASSREAEKAASGASDSVSKRLARMEAELERHGDEVFARLHGLEARAAIVEIAVEDAPQLRTPVADMGWSANAAPLELQPVFAALEHRLKDVAIEVVHVADLNKDVHRLMSQQEVRIAMLNCKFDGLARETEERQNREHVGVLAGSAFDLQKHIHYLKQKVETVEHRQEAGDCLRIERIEERLNELEPSLKSLEAACLLVLSQEDGLPDMQQQSQELALGSQLRR